MITIYNTLTKQKEPLKPIEPNKIGIYVCGLTAYDYYHIGNARVFITFDIIVRYLHHRGYEVFYVRNITDIDDKIIHRASVMQMTPEALAEKYIAAMHEDNDALGLLPPNIEPRATGHINDMVAMISRLIEKGNAYVASDGDVYYDIAKFKEYGKLSHQDLANLQSGSRVEVADVKRDPLDFVLWKMAKPSEPSWDSPWGRGRPGWHIECSVMSALHAGETFDIHGGGADLKFPHHENEIAQSEAAFGHKTVNTWMHVGFVEVNKEKMSKSLGNFFTLREVMKIYHPETIRCFMLASHYRSPLNYSEENLNSANASMQRLYTAIQDLPIKPIDEQLAKKYTERFNNAMCDDFNTPEALAVLFDIAHEINLLRMTNDLEKAAKFAAVLRKLAEVLGILQNEPTEFLRYGVELNSEDIEALINEREMLRKDKKWEEADEIRKKLLSMEIELEDKPGKTVWKKC